MRLLRRAWCCAYGWYWNCVWLLFGLVVGLLLMLRVRFHIGQYSHAFCNSVLRFMANFKLCLREYAHRVCIVVGIACELCFGIL